MASNLISSYIRGKEQKLQSKKKKNRITFMVLEDGKIAEQVFDEVSSFAVFDPATENIETKPALKIKEDYVYPLDGDLVSKKVILFPERVAEYGDTEKLRHAIVTYIHKYLDVEPFYETLASYYVLLTWLFDKNTVVTYLGFYGDFGSGKTRGAQVVGRLCYKSAFVSGALTCAPIYRMLEQARGTLVINEFDFDNSDMGVEMIKILNNGYERGMYVLRTEPKSGRTDAFDAFSPKVFTYRKKKKDEAFESRLITIPVEETLREDIPTILPLSYEREAMELRNQLLLFRFRNYHGVVRVDQSIFEGVERRIRQTLYPLLTVIDDLGFVKELGEFIKVMQKQQKADRGMSWLAEYLTALVELTCLPHDITIAAFADQYNKSKPEKEQINPKKAGYAVRNHLKLNTERITSGENKGKFRVVLDKEKVMALCTRYGVEIPLESSLHPPSSLPEPDVSGYSEDSELSQVVEGEVISRCDICGGEEMWHLPDGTPRCQRCHPPYINMAHLPDTTSK